MSENSDQETFGDGSKNSSKSQAIGTAFWIKLATACVLFAGVLDFLKGIVSIDLQVPAVLGGGALCIALTLLAGSLPQWRRQFHVTRIVVSSITVAVLALFGLQSQFENGPQHGALAQTFDWAGELQSDIRELLKATRDLDPRRQAEAYLEDNGYPLSLAGFSRAAKVGETTMLSAYSVAGLKVSADQFTDILIEAASDDASLINVLSATSFLAVEENERITADARPVLVAASQPYGLNSFHSDVCENFSLESWVHHAIQRDCENESNWYVHSRNTLSTIAQRLSVPLQMSSYRITGEFGGFEDLIGKKSDGLIRFRALATFREGEISIYSGDLRSQYFGDYRGRMPQFDCFEVVCSIDLHAVVFGGTLEFLDIADAELGPFADPRPLLNSGQGFDWMVGHTARWGAIVSDRAIYMATYDAKSQIGAAIFCEPNQGPGGNLTLRYIFDVAPSQAYSQLFQGGSAQRQSSQIRIHLATGDDIDGPGRQRSRNVYDMLIPDHALKGMMSTSEAVFKPTLSENYPIATRSLLAAFLQFRTYADCSTIDPATLAPIPHDESRWVITEDTNSLSGTREVLVYNEATDVNGKGFAHVTLYVRCRDDDTEGFILWRQPLKASPGGNSVAVALRLDDGAVRYENWNLANTGEAVFFPRWSGNFVRELYRAEQLAVMVPTQNDGDITAVFDIRKGEAEIDTLARACNWEIAG